MRWWLLILVMAGMANRGLARQVQHIAEKLAPRVSGKKPADSNLQQIFWITTSGNDTYKLFIRKSALPVTILQEYPKTNLLVVQTSWKTLDSLLLPAAATRFVEMPRTPKEEYALINFDHGLNTISALHSRYPAINGNGLVVSVKEDLFDTTDIDLQNRYLPSPLASPVMSPHATTMATIIAGAGNSYYTGKGPAWGALLHSADFANLLPEQDNDYRQYGISVQNHSYGTDIENYYGADAAAYDATVTGNPPLLHVFSAGNAGNRSSTEGLYANVSSFANITGSFKMAKNILTVGATDSFGIISPLSSRGPAYDGRIKPDVAAFGQDGTSDAAALTSGIGLLLQQAYRDLNNGQLPPAALVKAALINSARDAGTPGPDYRYGYGIADGLKAINTLLQQRYFVDSIADGALQTAALTVPPNIRRLSITVCWTDPPAQANAPRALVNDLDLVLVHNAGQQTWLPWVLSPFPHPDSLNREAVRARDSLNNTEQITLIDPPAGDYTIRINGQRVETLQQTWYAVYELDTANRFQWVFPNAAAQLTGNQRNILRWSSTFPGNATGTLQYSLDRGNSWLPVGGAVDLQPGYLVWQAPDTFSTVQLRMTIQGEMFVSDTGTLSQPPDVRVGFHCADSIQLYWNVVPGVQEYRVWNLGQRYMQPIARVTDTFIVLHDAANASPYYAVSPVVADTQQGIRSYALDYTLQGVGCYIVSLLADLAGSAADLTFTAGSLHQVQAIVFEKWANGMWLRLHSASPDGNLVYRYSDPGLVIGNNQYRAGVILANGQTVYSEPATVFFFGDARYLVFPNPAPAGSLLQVLTSDLQPRQLVLYNALGQMVRQQTYSGTVWQVQLHGLPKGTYFLVIWQNGRKDFTTPIVVN